MDFLRDLNEARLTKDSANRKTLTYNDACEKVFLMTLMLQTMRHFKQYRANAAAYARKTIQYDNFNMFRIGATDLHNLMFFVLGNEEAINMLKNPGEAKTLSRTVSIPVMAYNRHLRNIANLSDPRPSDNEILQKIESELKIKNADYISLRRHVVNLNRLDNNEVKKTFTRLIFAVRSKLPDSDLTDDFSKLVATANLEDTRYSSPEPVLPSTSADVPLNDVANYKFLVPVNQVPYVAKFLSLAKNGKSVMGTYVNSYKEIISMVDDIVQAGPVYIQQLKVLHQRAKKRR